MTWLASYSTHTYRNTLLCLRETMRNVNLMKYQQYCEKFRCLSLACNLDLNNQLGMKSDHLEVQWGCISFRFLFPAGEWWGNGAWSYCPPVSGQRWHRGTPMGQAGSCGGSCRHITTNCKEFAITTWVTLLTGIMRPRKGKQCGHSRSAAEPRTDRSYLSSS